MTTPYHARYFAHELTRLHGSGGVDRLSMALFDACVDLNPHQIEAAALSLRSQLATFKEVFAICHGLIGGEQVCGHNL